MSRVLFLCTGNSCRSILAEATFNHLAPSSWHAISAGSHPTGTVHPRSLALLAREGISTVGVHSKSWDDLGEAFLEMPHEMLHEMPHKMLHEMPHADRGALERELQGIGDTVG